MNIPLIKNTFYNEQSVKKELIAFIESAERLSIGQQCQTAERNFAELVRRKFCVLFNSGSSSNLALIQAYLNLGQLSRGDTVGVPALTWPTAVMPLIQLGLIPVLIDPEIETLNIASTALAKTHKRQPLKALFLTNVLSLCTDPERIASFCKDNGILFFEDNCESLGSVYQKTLLGNFGREATYSFFVGHHLSTIEGGAVVTDDERLYDMLLLVRAHGWNRNLSHESNMIARTNNNSLSSFYDLYTFYDLAFNLRPTEITGVLLQQALHFYDEIMQRRENSFKKIRHALETHLDGRIYPLHHAHLDKVPAFAQPVIARTNDDFAFLLNAFRATGFEIRPVVSGNVCAQPFFKKYYPEERLERHPNAQTIHDNGFYFSNDAGLNDSEIKYIVDFISQL